MLEIGFMPPEVTKRLPSTINRFFTSCDRPHVHHRAVPVGTLAGGAEKVPATVQDRAAKRKQRKNDDGRAMGEAPYGRGIMPIDASQSFSKDAINPAVDCLSKELL